MGFTSPSVWSFINLQEFPAVKQLSGILCQLVNCMSFEIYAIMCQDGIRISPPTSAGLPRRTPPEGAQILGQWIPGDTSASMTIYATPRDSEIFPDPEEYRPERWMNPEGRKRLEPYFIPFSAGARACLGRNITYLEQMVLASVVRRYEFALPSPDFRLERREAFNLLVGELPLKIWKRPAEV